MTETPASSDVQIFQYWVTYLTINVDWKPTTLDKKQINHTITPVTVIQSERIWVNKSPQATKTIPLVIV